MCEILAPAGSKSGAIAAINAGADAIYLGLKNFSARSFAENFEWEDLTEIINYAHILGVKVYVALNTLIKQNEVTAFFEAAVNAYNCGADALIIQDLYLGKLIKEFYPQIPLHLSTQAGVCNSYGASLAAKYGFDRVILARETKYEDIEKISKIIQTETFIQGALCTCFSGQCYLSSFAGGNSGNRGKCKQPCRKLYSIDRKGFEDFSYKLSLADLCVSENIKQLIKAGVFSFKIEGRMRRPEYVAAAVNYYKKLLADCADDNDFSYLKKTYNRGNYTRGLAFGQDERLISSSVQGHIGEYAGVVKVKNGKYVCLGKNNFTAGDGFKILRSGKEAGGGTYGGSDKEKFIIATGDRLKNGDKVFVTTDSAVNSRLLRFKRYSKVEVKLTFTAGQAAKAELGDLKVFSDEPLQRAEKQPLTEENLIKCFEKVDKLPIKPEISNIQTDGVFMSVSALNKFRRTVYETYVSRVCGRECKIEQIKPLKEQTFVGKNDKSAVICTDFKGVCADIAIIKPTDYSEIDTDSSFNGEKFLYLPPFMTDDELEKLQCNLNGFDGIYCDSNYGLKYAKKLGKKFFAGTGFNVSNAYSLARIEADYICISKELTLAEARPLLAENTFYFAAGDIKVMDLIYCPFGKKCGDCDKRQSYTLTDADDRKFTLRRYRASECRFEIYNCLPLAAQSETGKLYDLTLENAEKVSLQLSLGVEPEKIFTNYTRGHMNSKIF